VPNETIEDLVLVRSDGRPTYNFASPMEDVWDEITHVIRGEDHISNTPKQINIIRALGVEPPVYAHVPNVLGADGKKLSKRHGAVTVDEFRREGYYAPALMNFLALLGWSYDDKTTIMSRDELVERFSLERVIPSPAAFDYQKLDWMNGVYLRALPPDQYADVLVDFLRSEGFDYDEDKVRRIAPLVQDKMTRLAEFHSFAGFFFKQEVDADPTLLDRALIETARQDLEAVQAWESEEIEATLRGLAERLELSPREAFQPIRVAVTGSKVSPGLFESLELLGKEESLRRLSAAADLAAA
jgi:glutamyl-tRNA synthetase